ncbi:MAG: putative zinc-binding metallopeptidase [Planctomycetota bacterium]
MASRSKPSWARASDEELLALPFAELRLDVARSPLAPLVAELRDDLAARGLRFRPHVWFSSTWFAPDGVPGFALPFYLAHPRLVHLERRQMLEAEGASRPAARRLLRHECGHALDTAFGLHRRASWRRTFGRYSEPYRPSYSARPGSPDFVTHLPRWYAQSHPAEDWAETFAVWLGGGRRGLGAGARAKLAFVDELLTGLRGNKAALRLEERTEEVATLRGTLGDHYRARRRRLEREPPPAFDRGLGRLFGAGTDGRRRRSAAGVLDGLAGAVARRVEADAYSVREALHMLALRARQRGLVAPDRSVRAAEVAPLVERTLASVRRGRTLLYR